MEKNIVDGVENLTLDVKSDVIIAESTNTDLEVLNTGERIDVFKNISANVKPTISRELDSRWLYATNVSWKTSQAINHLLLDMEMPMDIVAANLNSPNIALFLQHRLWRGDIHIKFVMNSSQFNTGQLIAFWYYADKYDKNSNLRKNFYNGIQLPNVLISACSSNDVELFIPFKSFKSLLSTLKRPDDSDPLSMGSLCLAVSSPLNVATGSSGTVDVAVYVSFENSEFYGLIDRSVILDSYKKKNDVKITKHHKDSVPSTSATQEIVEGQMMTAKTVINTASDVLDTIYPDPNRDKPPGTTQFTQIVPLATSNWASGTNDVDRLYALRLDPTSQTPHPPGSCNSGDETLFDDIKKKMGYLSTLTWKDSHATGYLLSKIRACPDNPLNSFPKLATAVDELEVLPPVSVLASFNCYWRGSLKLTFDVIANASHKGALMIAYIPGATDDTAVSVDILKNSHNATFKLDGRTRFDFVIPYISDKPWWSVSETFSNHKRVLLPPGMIYVCVLNKLNIMNAVSKDIDINVYLSGGEDFEVAVPIPPTYLPEYSSTLSPYNKRNLYPKATYDENIGFGIWRYLSLGRGVLRYGSGADHITQWEGNMVPFGIYEIDMGKSVAKNILVKYKSGDKVLSAPLRYFARVIVNGDRDNYIYMTGFLTYQQALSYVVTWRRNSNGDALSDSPVNKMLAFVQDSDYVPGKLVLRFMGVEAQPQMNVDAEFDITQNLQSTQNGRITFGESFSNLVDYGRRYQPYCSYIFNSNAVQIDESNKLQCKIPVFPIGLELDTLKDFSKSASGGLIPLLLSGFRFYRGGIRMRMVVQSAEDVTLFVQHRMDQIAKSRLIIKVDNESNQYDRLESGYAQTFCVTKINPVVTMEIPFYNNGILALLQEPNFDSIAELQHFAMGYLSVSAQSIKSSTVNIQVYYSLADDFKMSHFIGFGPLRSINDVIKEYEDDAETEKEENEKAIQERVDDATFDDRPEDTMWSKERLAKVAKCIIDAIPDDIYIHEEVEEEYVEPQGFKDFFKKKATETVKEELVNNKMTIMSALHEFIEPILAKFADTVSDLRGRVSTIIANVGHMIISQDWKNVLWGCLSIFEVTGLCKSKYIDKMHTALADLWTLVCEKSNKLGMAISGDTREYVVVSPSDVPSKEIIEPQSDTQMTDEEVKQSAACFSTILGILVSSVDVSIRKVNTGSFFDEKKTLADLIKSNVQTSNGLFIFFRNTLSWMFELYKKIKYKFSKLPQIQYLIAEENEHVSQWHNDCLELLSSSEQEIVGSPMLNVKLIYCATVAKMMSKKALMAEWEEGTGKKEFYKFRTMTNAMCKRIMALEHEMIKYSQLNLVRYEPFVISQDGDAGVGKSFLTNSLSKSLLEAIDWKGKGETSITRTPGNKYWNGLRAQPVCIYDDFLQIQEGEPAYSDISELITLKSSAIFNPPQAAIEDKYIRYNPRMVFLNTNSPYCKVGGLGSQDPWRRRRDVMVHVKRTEEYAAAEIMSIPEHVRKNYLHLKFAFRNNHLEEDQNVPYKTFNITDTVGKVTSKIWLTYEEMKAIMIQKFVAYDQFESKNYADRLAEEISFKSRDDETLRELTDRYSFFLGRLCESRAERQSKMMKQVAKDIAHAIYGDDSHSQREVEQFITSALEIDLSKNDSDNVIEQFLAKTPGLTKDEEKVGILRTMVSKFRGVFLHSKVVPNKSEKPVRIIEEIVQPQGMFESLKNYVVGESEDKEIIEPQTSDAEFKPALVTYRTKTPIGDCPHRRLSEEIESFSYFHDIDELCNNYDFDDAIRGFLHDRFGKSIFMNLSTTEKLSEDLDFNTLKHILTHDPHSIVSARECKQGCWFQIDVRPGCTMAQLFWRAAIKNKMLKYNQLDVKLKAHIDPTDIDPEDRYDPRQDRYERLLNSLKEIASSFFFGTVGAICKITMQLVGFTVSFYLMGKFLMPLVMPKPTIVRTINPKAPQMSTYNDYIPKAHLKHGVSMRKPIIPQMNEESTNNVVNAVRKNTFFLKLRRDDKEIVMRCVGIKGYMFVMLDHYHDYIVNAFKIFGREKVTLDLVFDNVVIPISYSDFKLIHFHDSAIVCALLPQSIGRQFRNLLKHIPDVKSVHFGANFGKLIECDSTEFEIHKLAIHQRNSITIAPEIEEAGSTHVDTVWQHSLSRKGLCGSILCSDNNVTKPILGIHIAGVPGKPVGFCEAIVADTFMEAEKKFIEGGFQIYELEEPEVTGQSAVLRIQTNVEEIGSVGEMMACRPPEKSKLVKSPCFGVFNESTHEPPVMHPTDPRLDDSTRFSPLLSAVVYHGCIPRPFPNCDFRNALSDFRDLIISNVQPIRQDHTGVCDMEETIIGNPEFEIQSMELGTSEGYPYTKMRPGNARDKTWLIEVENIGPKCVLKGLHPMLEKIMEDKQQKRAKGIVPVTIFTDCLKDAKLPKEKILVPGKTRVFSLSPTDFTIQFRQYYLDFMCAYQKARFKADHAIGINVESNEWNEMVILLHQNSKCIVVGDYKKFGPTLMKKCVDACFEIIIEWYEQYYCVGEVDSQIRRIMGIEISNAYHLMIDNLYRTYCGAPSGSPITTILNSMVNSLYIRTAWNAIMGKEIFDDNVKMISYGDDIIMSVKEKVVEEFNCNTIADYFKNYEIVFTDAIKMKTLEGKFIAYGSIEDETTTFLRNTFVKHPTRKTKYIAKLDTKSAYEISNWIMKSTTPVDVTMDACKMYMRKLFPCGPELYAREKDRVIKYWGSKGYSIRIPTWYELDEEMFGEFPTKLFKE